MGLQRGHRDQYIDREVDRQKLDVQGQTQLLAQADLVCFYSFEPFLGALIAYDDERTTELVECKRWSATHSRSEPYGFRDQILIIATWRIMCIA